MIDNKNVCVKLFCKQKPLLKTMKEKTVCVVGLGYVGSPLPKPLVIENKSV